MSKTPRTKSIRPRASKTISTTSAESSIDLGIFEVNLEQSSIACLGAALVDSAIACAHQDPDRAVALVNAYIALLAQDSRARA